VVEIVERQGCPEERPGEEQGWESARIHDGRGVHVEQKVHDNRVRHGGALLLRAPNERIGILLLAHLWRYGGSRLGLSRIGSLERQ
jgi:hypothetical protein